MSLFARKPLETIIAEAHRSDRPTLRPVLGVWNLIALGIGAVIGGGIFVLTGQAAGANAGPAVVLSMLIAGLVSALAGLCYSEFASAVPVSGSAYTYAYATLGELVAWIIGWDLVLEYALSAATVAVGWSTHLSALLAEVGLQFPAAWSAAPGTLVPVPGGEPVTAVFNVPAVIVALGVTALLIRGVQESAAVNAVIVVVKVFVVLAVIVCGAFFFDPSHFTPFIPRNTGSFGEYGWSGILRGAAVIFFAYIGFDAVSTAAQEAKNPQRDMPIGILGSLAICTFLYMAVSGVLVGLVPYQQLKGQAAPMVMAIDAAAQRVPGTALGRVMNGLRVAVEIGALAGITSVMVVTMLGQSRIFLAMAADGLLPAWVGRIHPRFRTPHFATAITGLGVMLAAGFTPIGVLGALVSIGTLFAFVIVAAGLLFLRKHRPDLPRPFRTPFVPWVPLGSIAVNILLMASLPWTTWERLIVWMALGLALYFFYGRRKSVLGGALASPVPTGALSSDAAR
jgi:APA family basic amino acid/polyamine antiporter